MKLIHKISLDYRPIGLAAKMRQARKSLNSGNYSYYIPKMNGDIICIETDHRLKQGYSIKTLKPQEFILIN